MSADILYGDAIAKGLSARNGVITSTDAIRTLIFDPEVQGKQIFPGVPALNVPELLQKRTFLRIRLFHSLFGQSPMVRFINLKGAKGADWHVVARELTDFWDFEAGNTLGVQNTLRYCICEYVDYGTCVWKVARATNSRGLRVPMWQFVSIRDIIYPDGHGIDIDGLPWFGQIHRLTRTALKAGYAEGLYTQNGDKVLAAGESDEANIIATMYRELNPNYGNTIETFPVAEIWYDSDDGSKRMSLVHIPTGLPMFDGVAPSPRRPFFGARLDEKSPLNFLGVGVGDKLKAIGDVTNAIYNLAVGAGLAGLQQVKLMRASSRLAKIYNGADETIPIGPNDQAVTEDPANDLAVHALADARGSAIAVNLLQPIQNKADKLFGDTDAQQGNVNVARRSPAYGVARIMAEGSMPVQDALSRLAFPIKEAIYYTLDTYDEMNLSDRPVHILGNDAQELTNVFKQRGLISNSVVMNIKVADPMSQQDQRQQTALMQAQFVMQWTNTLVQVAQIIANPEPTIPQSLRQFLIDASSRVEELVRRVLESADNIQNYDSVIMDVETGLKPVMQEAQQIGQQMIQAAQQAQQMVAQGQQATNQQGGQQQ